jgi:hypothetical protein
MWKHVKTHGNMSNSEINFQPQVWFTKNKSRLCLKISARLMTRLHQPTHCLCNSRPTCCLPIWATVGVYAAWPTRLWRPGRHNVLILGRRLLTRFWRANVQSGSPCYTGKVTEGVAAGYPQRVRVAGYPRVRPGWPVAVPAPTLRVHVQVNAGCRYRYAQKYLGVTCADHSLVSSQPACSGPAYLTSSRSLPSRSPGPLVLAGPAVLTGPGPVLHSCLHFHPALFKADLGQLCLQDGKICMY